MSNKLTNKDMLEIKKALDICRGGFKYKNIEDEITDETGNGDRSIVFYKDKGAFIMQTIMNDMTRDGEYKVFTFKELWYSKEKGLVLYDVTRKIPIDKNNKCFHQKRILSESQEDIFNLTKREILTGFKNALERKLGSIQNRLDNQNKRISDIDNMIYE